MTDKKKAGIPAISLGPAAIVGWCQAVDPKAGKIAGLRDYWNFDEGKGNVVENVECLFKDLLWKQQGNYKLVLHSAVVDDII